MSANLKKQYASDSTASSRALYERACRVMPGGNTRDTLFFSPYPIYAYKGKGCRIIDVDGVERIDFVNNYSSLIHGHCHPKIEAAVQHQLQLLPAVGMPTETEIRLAELLCEQVPSVEQIRFTNSGTEAVMMALKAARQYTGKSKIAKFEGAYHGSYDWIEVSVEPSEPEAGEITAPASVPRSGAVTSSTLQDVLVLTYNDIEGAKALIEEHAADLAAVLIDPLVSRMGYVSATIDFLRMLRDVTRRCNVLLVFDEVYTLRLARGGLQKKRNITPDITAMGKIIGGCFPIGAVGGSAEIMSVFDPSRGARRLPHGGTYNANPISMSAGYAAMTELTPEAYAHLEFLGARARNGINEIILDAEADAQVMGEGSVLAIVPTRAPVQNWREFSICETRKKGIVALHEHLLGNGILMAPHGTFVLSTPMVESDIDDMLEAVRSGIHHLCQS